MTVAGWRTAKVGLPCLLITDATAASACRTRALLHILPLYVTAPKGLAKGTGRAGGAQRGPVITIQGCRLPDSRSPKASSDAQAQVRPAIIGA